MSLLFIFCMLLVFLPVAAQINFWQAFNQTPNQTLKFVDSFFRAGSLVFGGGHVVLPLLQSEVVSKGWVSKEMFMAGYGAAQAIPGPLFSFTAYLGAVSQVPPSGWLGAAICLVAAFYNPVWTSAILNTKDFILATICFLLLTFWKTPSWIVVIFGAVSGQLLSLMFNS